MPRRRYRLRPARPLRRRHRRRARQPHVLPPGPRRRPGRVASSSRRSRSRSSPSASASCSTSSSGAASRASTSDRRREDAGPLDEPLNEAFRADSLTLGWDGDAERILVEARAQDEDGEADDPGRGRRRGRGRPRPAPRAADRRRGAHVRRPGLAGHRRRPAALPAVRPAARPAGPHLPAAQRPLRQLAPGADRPDARPRDDPRGPARRASSRSSGGSSSSTNNAMFVRVTRPCPEPEPSRSSSRPSTSRPSASGRSTTSRTGR